MSGILDQYDRERFKTVVNNEHIHIEKNIQYIIHIEKTFTNMLQTKNLMKYLGSIAV